MTSPTPSKRKKSAVWLLMEEVEGDRHHARCTLCAKLITTGSEKSRTTANMRSHLINSHPSDWARADAETKATVEREKRASIASPSMAPIDLTGERGPSTSQLTMEVSE